ncbi:MAG: FAD/NAD(P)-binding protein [Proteobacteria bacterium]|jgi:NAD(P)H-flavin reductase|nr:FAD/NAD(P)-binding protein [Pseudomonadota bacterium]
MQPAEQLSSPYIPEKATIKKITQLTETEKLFLVSIDSGRSLGHAPGQFVEVSLFGIGEGPISISSPPARDNTFELGVRAAGNLTRALHGLKSGDALGIRGPFGHGFPVENLMGKDLLFVAGGIGLVPLRSLIKYSLEHRDAFGRIIILFGARSPQERLFTDELAAWSKRSDIEFLETVDRSADGWKGNVGVITTLFKKITIEPRKTAVMIVGPPVMYKYALLEVKEKEVPRNNIWLSLERRMKCGLGKCGHCQINNYYVCQEGPVFAYPQIEEKEEAL